MGAGANRRAAARRFARVVRMPARIASRGGRPFHPRRPRRPRAVRTAPRPLALFPREISPAAFRLMAGHAGTRRSEEHTSELQSLMRISYAVFCLKKKK